MMRCGCVIVAWASAVAIPGVGAGEPADSRPTAVTRPIDNETSPARLGAALLAETNRVRRAHGCRPLRPLPELNDAANDQAAYMALFRHADHGNALNGQANVLERVLRHGIRPVTVAENVASQPSAVDGTPLSSATLAANLVEAWMSSPGHRANLLNRKFTHFGCAARVMPVIGHSEYVFAVQVFASLPMSEPWEI